METKYYTALLEIIIAKYDFFQIKEAKEFSIPSEMFYSIEGIIFIVLDVIFYFLF